MEQGPELSEQFEVPHVSSSNTRYSMHSGVPFFLNWDLFILPNIPSSNARYCIHCGSPVLLQWDHCKNEECHFPRMNDADRMPAVPGWSWCRKCQIRLLRDGQIICDLCGHRNLYEFGYTWTEIQAVYCPSADFENYESNDEPVYSFEEAAEEGNETMICDPSCVEEPTPEEGHGENEECNFPNMNDEDCMSDLFDLSWCDEIFMLLYGENEECNFPNMNDEDCMSDLFDLSWCDEILMLLNAEHVLCPDCGRAYEVGYIDQQAGLHYPSVDRENYESNDEPVLSFEEAAEEGKEAMICDPPCVEEPTFAEGMDPQLRQFDDASNYNPKNEMVEFFALIGMNVQA